MAAKRTTGFGRDVEKRKDGFHCWQVDGWRFLWQDGHGINLYVIMPGRGQAQPLIFANSLAQAGLFAEGLVAGWAAKERLDPKP